MKLKEKKLDIIIFIIIIIAITSNMLLNEIGNLDEIWNYTFAKNIADGLIPYRDFNLVQTPLLSIICGILLIIFPNQLITMRIIGIILLTTIFYLCYKILQILLKDKKISGIIIMILLLLFQRFFTIDYNYGNLLIALILIFMELKISKKTSKIQIIIGMIAGLAILTKQSTGVLIVLACLVNVIIKKNKKDICYRLAGMIIPLVIFLIYLIINNALNEFIDYAILGIKTFSNYAPYTILFTKEWYFKVLAIIVPVTLIVMFIRIFIKRNDEKNIVLFLYGIANFFVVFPISDEIHFLIASVIILLGFIYSISLIYLKIDEKIHIKIKAILFAIICGILASLCAIICIRSVTKIKERIKIPKETELKHFYGIAENKFIKEKILTIDKYIEEKKKEGKKVYILDSEAAIYMINLDIYNKDYDMFNKGNLGSKGEKGIIERIQTEENAIYLIRKDGIERNWQNPEEVRKYIKDYLNKTGQISMFDIYEK